LVLAAGGGVFVLATAGLTGGAAAPLLPLPFNRCINALACALLGLICRTRSKHCCCFCLSLKVRDSHIHAISLLGSMRSDCVNSSRPLARSFCSRMAVIP